MRWVGCATNANATTSDNGFIWSIKLKDATNLSSYFTQTFGFGTRDACLREIPFRLYLLLTDRSIDRFTFTNMQLVRCNSIVFFFIVARRHVEMNRKRGKFETQRYDAKDIRYIAVRCNA